MPSTAFSVAIATPTHRGLFSAAYVRSLWGLQQACIQRGIRVELLMLPNQSMVDRARNILAGFFLHKTDYSHLLFIDDDMGFEVADALKMFNWPQHDVVAAAYPCKEIDWARVKHAVLHNPDIDPQQLPQIAGKYDGMHTFLHEGDSLAAALDEPMQVGEAGTGMMLISRACLLRLADDGIPCARANAANDFPLHEFFRQKVKDGRLLGEDFYFCDLVREHGGAVYLCAWSTIVHSGQYEFVGNTRAVLELP
jgi:hypothetical protein